MTTAFSSNSQTQVSVTPRKTITVNTLIFEREANIPFTAVVTYSNRHTGQFLMNRTVVGIWTGVAASKVVTKIN